MQKIVYKTLQSPSKFEIPKIKGSRFFATIFPIDSKEQAETYLEEMRKTYYDATHNCYAWRCGVQANQDLFWNWILTSKLQRSSDDWEPANTAWKPILSVLTGEEIFDVLVVVTRYFWGTLLGVWGLIQAYTQATKEWIQNLDFVYKSLETELDLDYDYDQLSSAQYLFDKYECRVLQEQYSEQVWQKVAVNIWYVESLKREFVDRQLRFSC